MARSRRFREEKNKPPEKWCIHPDNTVGDKNRRGRRTNTSRKSGLPKIGTKVQQRSKVRSKKRIHSHKPV